MAGKTSNVKLPLVLRALSVALILCPIGNFLISFYMSDISQKMALSQIGEILPMIPPLDWLWNGLIALSGVLILLRRKLSWLIAIASIFFCTAINFYKFFTYESVPFGWGYVIMTFSISLAAALVVAYFRYPYLDRRDRWVKVNRRSTVKLPVKIVGGPSGVEATNLSSTGAKLEFSGSSDFSKGQELKLDFGDHTVKAHVIWVKPSSLGVSFVNPSRAFKNWTKNQ